MMAVKTKEEIAAEREPRRAQLRAEMFQLRRMLVSYEVREPGSAPQNIRDALKAKAKELDELCGHSRPEA